VRLHLTNVEGGGYRTKNCAKKYTTTYHNQCFLRLLSSGMSHLNFCRQQSSVTDVTASNLQLL